VVKSEDKEVTQFVFVVVCVQSHIVINVFSF